MIPMCPFNQKPCIQACQLYIQGECAITVIAQQQAIIAKATTKMSKNDQGKQEK